MTLDIEVALRAAAPNAPVEAWRSLERLGDGLAMYQGVPENRVANAMGQTAHECVEFTRTVESLYYKKAETLMAVWPSRFRTEAEAAPYTRSPEKLANNVYGGRMGNVDPGDGWRYRGRGYLQLTGRHNYRTVGEAIGIDLEADPELAREPEIAWRIADHFLATHRFRDRTAYQWADEDEPEIVTRIVNGGFHGLADRLQRTAAAWNALCGIPPTLVRGNEGPAVLSLQQALARAGFSPGPVDGDFGPLTESTVRRFQSHAGLHVDGIVGAETREALGLLA